MVKQEVRRINRNSEFFLMDFLSNALIYFFGIGFILLFIIGSIFWFIEEGVREKQWGAVIITIFVIIYFII